MATQLHHFLYYVSSREKMPQAFKSNQWELNSFLRQKLLRVLGFKGVIFIDTKKFKADGDLCSKR